MDKMIQSIVRAMLKERLVDKVIAFVQSDSSGIVPMFIATEEDAKRITAVSYYPCSLAKLAAEYADKDKKIGMVVRSCDARAVVELAKRRQLNRDNFYLIGIECHGVFSYRNDSEIYVFPEGVKIDGEFKSRDETALSPHCRRCEYPVPFMADVICRFGQGAECSITANTGKGKTVLSIANITFVEESRSDSAKVKERTARWQEKEFGELKKMEPAKRLGYWLSHFDRCIKCYGCRNSCPLCCCKDCYLEPERLLIPGEQVPPNWLFHIARLIDIGDSCLNCGQCEAACPMEIPVARLYHMLHKELSLVFKYESGIDMASLPPLSVITEQDLARPGVSLD